ncbi:MAG: hypothetical protein JWN76_1876 [Chitinophagaceae bacterium]|nr:hypothetical protein [Chitinophagaceae bacterium]
MNLQLKVMMVWIMMLFVSLSAWSQNHFLYIQADDQQKFALNLNQKNYTSGKTGYVIIPQLTDGQYTLVIKKQQEELKFPVLVKGKDLGFTLKNNNGKWHLLNIESKSVIGSGTENTDAPVDTGQPSEFAKMLAEATSDPSLLQIRFDETARPKKEVVKSDKKKKTGKPVKQTGKDSMDNSLITKVMEQANQEGTSIVFYDQGKTKVDTIKVLIPADKKAGKGTADRKKTDKPDAAGVDTFQGKLPERPLKDSVSNPFKQPFAEIKTLPAKNSNCTEVAADDDFIKLRKRMAAQNSDALMIQSARKAFSTKCYTSQNIKNLSTLFLNDQTRFQFFQMAFAFVYDPANYNILEDQLLDEKYKDRFRTMLRL